MVRSGSASYTFFSMRFHRTFILFFFFGFFKFFSVFCWEIPNTSFFDQKYEKVPKSPQNHQMWGKGEILRYTYKTIGEISPFSTISHYPNLWTSAVTAPSAPRDPQLPELGEPEPFAWPKVEEGYALQEVDWWVDGPHASSFVKCTPTILTFFLLFPP